MTPRRFSAPFVVALLLAGSLAALVPTASAAPPEGLTSLTATPTTLSPNADGVADSTTIRATATAGQTLYANVYDAAGLLRRSGLPLAETSAGTYVAAWDGRLAGGATATEAASPLRVKVSTSPTGNALEEAPAAVTLDIDLTAPAGASLVIDGGARYVVAADRSVTLGIGATAPTTGFQMRVAEGAADTAFTGVAWEPFATSKPFTLSAGDGAKTLRLQVRDAAGNVAPTVTAATTLDTTDPGATVTINSGDAQTTDTAVRLALTATDASGVSQMRLSNDNGATFPGGWESFATTKAWTFPGVGTRTVLVEVRDGAGRTGRATDSIVVGNALAGQTIAIDGGAAYSTDTEVALTLGNPQPTTYTQMAFSHTGLPGSYGAVQPFARTTTWTLDGAADGPKTVYYRLQTADGTTADTSAGIVLDRTVPTATLALRDAAGSAVSLTGGNGVVAVVSGADANGVTGARAAASEAALATLPFRAVPAGGAFVWCFASADPLAAPPATAAGCPAATDGAKTLFVQTRDAAGLVSTAVSRSVTRDTAPPTIDAFAVQGLVAGRTGATTLPLSLAATDAISPAGALQVAFRVDGGGYTAWAAYSTTPSFALPSAARTNGAHVLEAKVRDAAGNEAPAARADFTFDGTGPVAAFDLRTTAGLNPTATNARTVTLETTASDDSTGGSGVTLMRVWLASAPEPTTTPGAFAGTSTFTLANVQGAQSVNVRVFDSVGNPSAVVSRTIVYDTVAPSGEFTLVGTGPAGYTRTRDVTIQLSSLSETAAQIAVSETADPTTGFVPLVGGTHATTLSAGDGLKRVYVAIRDAAGNTGAVRQLGAVGIVLDTAAPTTTAPAGVDAWRNADTTFALAVTDATSGPASTAWRIGTGAARSGTTVEVPVALGDGTHTLTFASTDSAGNVEADRTATLRIDATAPTTVSNALAGATHRREFDVTFTPSDAASGVAAVRYSFDAPTGPWTELRTAPYAVRVPTSLGAGAHTLYFRSIDAAGNEEAVRSTAFTFDFTPPAAPTTRVTGLADGEHRNAAIALTLVATAAGGADATVRYRLDGATAWTTLGTGSRALTLPTSLGAGAHTLQLSALDVDGVEEPVRTVRFTFDLAAPTGAGLTLDGLTGGATSRTTLRALVIGADDLAGDALRMAFRVDGGAFTALVPFAGASDVELPAAARTDGTHTIEVKLVDAAGNEAVGAPATFRLDTTAPTASLAVPSRSGARTLIVTLSGSDAGSGVASYRLWVESLGEPATSLPLVPTTTVTLPATDGAHTVALRVFDAAGNPSSIATALVTLDSLEPSPYFTLGGSGPEGLTISRAVTLTLSRDPSPGMQVAIAQTPNPTTGFRALSGRLVGFELDATDGLQRVHVTLRQSDGTLLFLGQRSITLDTRAPVTALTTTERDFRVPATLTLSASDAGSGVGATTWALDGGPTQTGTSVLLGAGLAEGVHTLTFRSTDVAGNVEALRTVTLNVDMTAPLVTGEPQGHLPDRGAPIVLTFSEAMAQDATLAAVTVSPPLPGPVTATWSGTKLTLQAGVSLPFSTAFTVTVGTGATDRVGNALAAPATFRFTTEGPRESCVPILGRPCSPPAVLTFGPLGRLETRVPTLDLVVRDAATATVTIDGAPVALRVTGDRYTGEPTAPLSLGTHTARAVFVNGIGTTVTEWSFTVAERIAPAPPAPTPVACPPACPPETPSVGGIAWRIVETPDVVAETDAILGGLLLAAYDITPIDTTTGAPATPGVVPVRLRVAAATLDALRVDRERVVIVHWTGAAWEPLATTLVAQDAETVTYEALTASFSPFALVADIEAPTLAARFPTDGALLPAAEAVTLLVTLSDTLGLRDHAVVLDDADVTGRATLADGALTVPGPTTPGRHTLLVRATDMAGNTAVLAIAFTIVPDTPLERTATVPHSLAADTLVVGPFEGAEAAEGFELVDSTGKVTPLVAERRADGTLAFDLSGVAPERYTLRFQVPGDTRAFTTSDFEVLGAPSSTDPIESAAPPASGNGLLVLAGVALLALAVVALLVRQRRQK